jgi:hypothetical protein
MHFEPERLKTKEPKVGSNQRRTRNRLAYRLVKGDAEEGKLRERRDGTANAWLAGAFIFPMFS